MKKMITCPIRGCLAELQYEMSAETSQVLGATRCSLIEGEVDCEQECIARMKARQRGQLSKDGPEVLD